VEFDDGLFRGAHNGDAPWADADFESERMSSCSVDIRLQIAWSTGKHLTHAISRRGEKSISRMKAMLFAVGCMALLGAGMIYIHETADRSSGVHR
jgi:hypothetical protein